ncbi:hypothetical protein, partial [Halocynthiibacter sp.]|uniref:hypothetical protein n=1 Tax=Halocynthiibacter sp. TaxID=1979210 RepID=UPI003C3422DC
MNDLPIQNPNSSKNASLHNVGNFEDLTQVSQPNVWLANFATNTRTTYSHSVKDFIAKMGLQCEEDLYRVTQAHIIAYRDRLK